MTLADPADESRRWPRFALADLKLAQVIAADSQHAPHLGCFHARQAVEEALKAGLPWSSIAPPRQHDLDGLRTLLPQSWLVHHLHPELGSLTEWAVESRYPGNWPEATTTDAETAVRQARTVWVTILDDLEWHGLDVAPFR